MSYLAHYRPSPIFDYMNNPLIEALPPILSEMEAAQSIAHFPTGPDDERNLPKEIRLHCIDRVRGLVQPLPIHLELESAVSAIIRSGYVGRNPMNAATWKQLHTMSINRQFNCGFNSTASTFSLIGLSGIGKSTALNVVLNLYPQTIIHCQYQKNEFIHTQITWLKVECPFDGSLSGLCLAFFKALDKALGVDGKHSPQMRSGMGIQGMIQRMEQLASTYFIGALFIDELQHLNCAKTGGKDNMLNFFVNLINSIGIPVVFVGTNSMVDLFSDVLRNARRACGLGIYDFKRPNQGDASWDMLVNVLWDYQWVKRPGLLNPEVREVLYRHTQGVTDFLAKIMILAQRYAIQSNIETLNADVFNHVADTKMKLLKPALAALRSGDLAAMNRFEDLMPPDVQLEAMISHQAPVLSLNTLASMRADMSKKTSVPQVVVETTATVPIVVEKNDAMNAVAREIAQDKHPISLLKKYGWLVDDVFEFSDAYGTGIGVNG